MAGRLFVYLFIFSSHLHNIYYENKSNKMTEKQPKIEGLILNPKDRKNKDQGRDYIIYVIEHKITCIDTVQNY